VLGPSATAKKKKKYQYPNCDLLFCAKEGKYAGNVTVLSVCHHVCRFTFLLQILEKFNDFRKISFSFSPQLLKLQFRTKSSNNMAKTRNLCVGEIVTLLNLL